MQFVLTGIETAHRFCLAQGYGEDGRPVRSYAAQRPTVRR